MDSTTWDERYTGTEPVWSTTPNQWVEQATTELPPGRVLDLAGGEGRNALWLADRGWAATVVDFSQVALDRARALASERFGAHDQRLVTVQADLLTYQPEPASFDLVLVVYLHLPFRARAAVLARAAAGVAPGGRLLVVAHHTQNLAAGVGGPQDPLVLYTGQDVAADIAGTGLVILRNEAVHRTVDTQDGPCEAIDALFLAARTSGASSPTQETQP